MARIVVEFSASRDFCGVFTLIDDRGRKICGPWPVAGRATDLLAETHGNPRRNPLLRYGDTPTGSYRVLQTLRSGSRTSFRTAEFGSHGVILMEGISNDAALAEANGRFHMLIIGGKPSKKGGLRSTAGALRLANEHQKALVAALRKLPNVQCDVIECRGIARMGKVCIDALYREEDPPAIAAEQISSGAPRSTRDKLRAGASGAAGAMVFTFSVSFVALDVTPAHASTEVALPNTGTSREPAKFVLPDAVESRPHFRVAFDAANDPYGAPVNSSSLDKDKFVQYMDDHSANSYTIAQGNCAAACRDGLKAAGLDVSDRPHYAKDYGPFLERHGAEPVSQSNYAPEKGDIAVFSANQTHREGHVQVYDGNQWVSDFKNAPGKFSPYHSDTPPSTVYRFPDKH